MKSRSAGGQSVAVATVKRFDEPDGIAFINRRRHQKDPLGSLQKLAHLLFLMTVLPLL